MKSVWDLIGVNAPEILLPLEQADGQLSHELRQELQALLIEEAEYRSATASSFDLQYSASVTH
jgi:hypothetical protein